MNTAENNQRHRPVAHGRGIVTLAVAAALVASLGLAGCGAGTPAADNGAATAATTSGASSDAAATVDKSNPVGTFYSLASKDGVVVCSRVTFAEGGTGQVDLLQLATNDANLDNATVLVGCGFTWSADGDTVSTQKDESAKETTFTNGDKQKKINSFTNKATLSDDGSELTLTNPKDQQTTYYRDYPSAVTKMNIAS